MMSDFDDDTESALVDAVHQAWDELQTQCRYLRGEALVCTHPDGADECDLFACPLLGGRDE
jgi:hypothetical protein